VPQAGPADWTPAAVGTATAIAAAAAAAAGGGGGGLIDTALALLWDMACATAARCVLRWRQVSNLLILLQLPVLLLFPSERHVLLPLTAFARMAGVGGGGRSAAAALCRAGIGMCWHQLYVGMGG
jgi:hypothetical protein